jgi:hypothetical protein
VRPAQGVFGYFLRSQKVTRRPQAGESIAFALKLPVEAPL